MSEVHEHEWILPASIPFEELKNKDLEECVYWLLDAMGAKDLEWRIGGTGGGASDGGRDLEAHFFGPDDDGEISEQKWWVECKGRQATVRPREVKEAVNNSLAHEGLDRIVIATNTQFSNPTIDWVKDWQKKFPKPTVYLWDKAHLERYLSRHPEVVLRLFSEALSLDGRLQALESRFWNKLEFVTPTSLSDLWKERKDLSVTHMGLIALIANEFANGAIVQRPWGATFDAKSLIETLSLGLQNIPYLMIRSTKTGIDQTILFRTFAYLVVLALDALPADAVASIIEESLTRGGEVEFPDDVHAFLLMPIIDQLLSEMQDVCSEDCRRISCIKRKAVTKENDEIENYWLRFETQDQEVDEDQRYLLIEKHDAPCVVGFKVDKENGCPLFAFEPTTKNTADLLDILKRVAAFRKAEASQTRAQHADGK